MRTLEEIIERLPIDRQKKIKKRAEELIQEVEKQKKEK